MRPKVLLVEDSTSLAVLYKQYVKDEPYDIFHVETGAEAKTFIERHSPQLVILDLKLPDMPGEEVLDWISANEIPTAVIIATAHGSVNIAVDLIQRGAEDFLEKPIQADRLKTSVRLHLKRAKLENLVDDMQSKFDRDRFHNFIGSCLPMQAVYKIIDSVAPTTASVFINGESGTGKEVCAEAIHQESQRNGKPFVAINCGAIPRDLMESEIFGHVKGAFTGATADRKGAAMQAHGGTLFLDELCEMELEMQKKLLRFLQTGTFTPLGGNREIKVDVRIICATNRDPLVEVEEGRFREDLYYRVHVVPIEMPPLRERGGDIVTLCNHFLKLYAKQDKKKFKSIDKETQNLLKRYAWPGNVRQLQNIIRNIVVLNNETSVTKDMLPPPINKIDAAPTSKSVTPIRVAAPQTVVVEAPEAKLPPITPEELEQSSVVPANNDPMTPAFTTSEGAIRPMWQIEREAIQHAINHCDGNVLNAAVLLELSPSTVYRKKQAWESEDEYNQA
ncbi:sigma 54-interacting transcriptional regulator [Vibrio splendidus]|uniref:Sigma 54-interacting transcriptional regulator n=1 Tax=Vibrio splendidus TaxID=29497 RepID=A0ABD5A5F3_VIBSP|nr:sigma-54 dependent transcriptional regulator [Vibrio splendidus]MDH5895992.1 sigma 54-interacting transcriptional regulator [Vibrio splendidus]MDP2488463.1 sigma 54-interacting transcriptional regulator [Vibrio splendidus]OEF45037.1 sigma-54-dependent Fis family transcriptional regulator [Vibrio splendidus 1S-124]PMK37562.1 sigma-54-dependent Fis family transcriptional regulator [Vibrio splendidus]PMO05229.1 sigma-54-dependent Fis family transcriptional regulator [Vibrio splendidus]